jgi:8-oxo-dGTP pyrophosphatase MutT (NUDIX family)|tara:strand:- start:56 stop:499 length:444 start_codon:yes stop_codon:yes gene_type:complete
MKKKILTFVVNERKFLALYSEPHPDHGEGGWFVVTGGVEGNETHEEAVAREVLEEIGLAVDEIIPLNWGSVYNWGDELCEELNFVSFVKPGEIILNEEHSKFDWLDIDEFIERIEWDDDKELLKKILEKALNKEKYFNEAIFKDYRK